MSEIDRIKADPGLLIREKLERIEHLTLSPLAAKSDRSRGRLRPEPECRVRPAFQHDRDRIVHSKAFRRLKHKTQVFLAPRRDHYRTRLTHTIEVSQIARTAASALFLNENLTEAIAFGHDLGHTPFGHAGEYALDEVMPGGFHHWEQSLRVVDELALEGRGLNLTFEVRDGILKHSKGRGNPFLGADGDDFPATLEGKLVRAADIVAYTNHDLQDAIEAGLIEPEDAPRSAFAVLGRTNSERINSMVSDLIVETGKRGENRVAMSPDILAATEELRNFLFEAVYENPAVQNEFRKSRRIIHQLFEYFVNHPESLREQAGKTEFSFSLEREAADFIAGMSDSYALHVWEELFRPKPWGY